MKLFKLFIAFAIAFSFKAMSSVAPHDLSPASDDQGFFCAYIGGDLDAYGGDVEGRVAVGGNYTVHSSYSIGDRLVQSNGGRDDAIIDGVFTNQGANWQVFSGNLVYGDNYAGTMVSFGGQGNHAFQQKGRLDFDAAFAYFRSQSAALAALPDNGEVLHDGWGGITFRGSNAKQNVFTFPLDALQSWGATITIDVPKSSTVIINVPGSSFYMPGGSINNPYRDNTVFNFYEASDVKFRWYQMEGTVLAPDADFSIEGGQINGQAIIGGDAVQKGGGEFHNYEFKGHFHSEPPVVIRLASFSAVQSGVGVQLSWRTETESLNAGFHVWRMAEGGDYRRITDEMILGQGSSSLGASYSYTDTDVQNGAYYYKLQDISVNGEETFSEPIRVNITTGVENQSETIGSFELFHNYPNPFNPSTTIAYQLPEAAQVHAVIFDALGRLVAELVNDFQQPGSYTMTWDGSSNNIPLPSGLYFLSLHAGDFNKVIKMTLKK